MSKGAWICAAATIRNLGVPLAATTVPGILAGLHESIVRHTADLLAPSDHASFIANKSGFMLQAKLGEINIGRYNIITTWLIAAAVSLPRTLIASVCGVNRHFMPEPNWPYEHPLALLIILVSPVPRVVSRRRRPLQAVYRRRDGS